MFTNPSQIIAGAGISEGMHVGDFGSGTGAYLLPILREVEDGGAVYAVDIQRDLIGRVQDEYKSAGKKNALFFHGDLEMSYGSKIADQALDFVVASNIFYQVRKKRSFLEEAVRTLHPGGKLLVIDWLGSFGHLGPHPDHVFHADDARMFCAQAGLRYVKPVYSGEYHYGIVFEKAR